MTLPADGLRGSAPLLTFDFGRTLTDPARQTVGFQLDGEVSRALRRSDPRNQSASTDGHQPTRPWTALLALYTALLHRYGGHGAPDRFCIDVSAGPGDVTVSVDASDASFATVMAGRGQGVGAPASRPFAHPRLVHRTAPPAGDVPDSDGVLSLTVIDNGHDAITGQLSCGDSTWPRWALDDAVALLTDLATSGCATPEAAVHDLIERSIDARAARRTSADDAIPSGQLPCLHESVTARAAETPDAVAVRDERGALTYAELDRRADQLAHLLREAAVRPETTVGVRVGRDSRTVVAFLAVLKAGGAYVPVEGRDPSERRDTVLTDAEVLLELVCDDSADLVRPDHPPAAPGILALVLDPDWRLLAGQPASRVGGPTPPERAAYVLYTSGTTGTPKGVVIEHRQVSHYVHAITQRLGLRPGMRWLVTQSLAVDSSVTALMPALSLGGEVHLVSQERVVDPDRLAEWIQQYEIDAIKIAASHLRALQATSPAAPLLPRELLVIGCEASDWPWMRDLQRSGAGCTVVNHYGPTETTVGVLTLRVEDHLGEDWEVAPIGYPLAGVGVRVLDAAGRTLPDGVTGELVILGPTVGRGYHRREELTARSFAFTDVPHPGHRSYRTGDFGRRRPDGLVEFLGRRDDQIKIRGHRVALGEIDAALRAHPDVAHAVTLVREDTPGDRRLVAYVQPASTRVTVDLDRHLGERLPAHMLPRDVVVMTSLPLTSSGKIARAQLPAPKASLAAAPAADVSQQLVMDVWRELLGTQVAGPDQNFFDAGGHSLLLVQLQRALEERSGMPVPLLELFRHTTVRAQAGLLATAGPIDRPAASRQTVRPTPAQSALQRRRNEQAKARRAEL